MVASQNVGYFLRLLFQFYLNCSYNFCKIFQKERTYQNSPLKLTKWTEKKSYLKIVISFFFFFLPCIPEIMSRSSAIILKAFVSAFFFIVILIGHLLDGVILLLQLEFFTFFLSYLILAISARFKQQKHSFAQESKTLKYSGRSSKMTPSCKWPILNKRIRDGPVPLYMQS